MCVRVLERERDNRVSLFTGLDYWTGLLDSPVVYKYKKIEEKVGMAVAKSTKTSSSDGKLLQGDVPTSHV